jgi:DNA-binding response OmpR family regulator
VHTRLDILVVEDNDELRELLIAVLREEGHRVGGVGCAEDVVVANFDLILLDLNLPGEDGFALARHVRRIKPDIGLIMVTARNLPEDRRDGYDSGADIYLPKPVSYSELCSAIDALTRRLKPETNGLPYLQFHVRQKVLLGKTGQIVSLSARECMLLSALCGEFQQRLSSWQLIALLKIQGAADTKATLELHVVRLRKKLQQAGDVYCTVQAIRGWGYQLRGNIVIV